MSANGMPAEEAEAITKLSARYIASDMDTNLARSCDGFRCQLGTVENHDVQLRDHFHGTVRTASLPFFRLVSYGATFRQAVDNYKGAARLASFFT